jgi:hypothetical protein
VILTWMLAYVVTGAFVGFLAGLLGIGGGMTLVPVLAAMFAAQQFAPDHTVHLALGTAWPRSCSPRVPACARTIGSAASTGRWCAASGRPW